ncbi:MAG: queuosine precursor transporter [Bacteroidota bacterium]|nr:queuosine precursor transporter [Bacteroidota bacterium]MEC8968699.1 queuosine precursor transporter [Bacteroidota bacterium]
MSLSRSDKVFLILTSFFLGSLTMLNILGTSRFIDFSFTFFSLEIPFVLAIGVLPYPITFLCTDLISELFGKKRANFVVWLGLLLNLWVIFIVWLGGALDAPISLSNGELPLNVTDGEVIVPHGYEFYHIRKLTLGATAASMIAYLAAQFIDVQIFHFLKKKTNGKMLWLRNNVSTLVSQLVDTSAVILITYYYANGLPLNEDGTLTHPLIYFILSGYVFKVVVALLDTLPFYIATRQLKKYISN